MTVEPHGSVPAIAAGRLTLCGTAGTPLCDAQKSLGHLHLAHHPDTNRCTKSAPYNHSRAPLIAAPLFASPLKFCLAGALRGMRHS
jgi:hypothetical protein